MSCEIFNMDLRILAFYLNYAEEKDFKHDGVGVCV